VKLMYRYQWVAFADAPSYLYLSWHGRLTKPFNPGDQALRTSGNAISVLEDRVPKGKLSFLGGGAQVFSETRGPLDQKGLQLNIAYHYPIARSWKIAAGLSALIDNTKLRLDKITLEDPDGDELYNRLLSEGSSFTYLNIRPGFVVYHSRFYFGYSFLSLVNAVIQDAGVDGRRDYYKGVINSGYAFRVNSDLQVKPAIVGLISNNDKLHVDYSVKLYLRDRIWGGLVYRDVKSGVAMIGFVLNSSVAFGYSYERSLDNFNQFNDGSHELVVNFRLSNVRKENPYLW